MIRSCTATLLNRFRAPVAQAVLCIAVLGGSSAKPVAAQDAAPARRLPVTSETAPAPAAVPDPAAGQAQASRAIPSEADLPDAPQPTFEVAALNNTSTSNTTTDAEPEPFSFSTRVVPKVDPFARAMTVEGCPYEKGPDPRCRVHWGQFAIEGSLYLAFQNAGNLYTGYYYREETLTGKWWDRYVSSVQGWRWNVWADQNPFLDDYIGHPMQGAITNSIWIQNDPKGMTVEQGNNWTYYRSRLRALGFSTFFSTEWKLGPIGEASIGHNGDHSFFEKGSVTNETGWVELVTTPVGGMLWTVGEDYLDRTLIPHLEAKPHGPLVLFAYSLLTPARTTANILRFRAPWYRDNRVVKANSFFSDPEDDVESSPDALVPGNAQGDSLAAPASVQHSIALGRIPPIGGKHEFGVIWGISLSSEGPAGDVKCMPVIVRYSYLLHQGDEWSVRYAPEFTALSLVDFPSPVPYGVVNYYYDQRTRAYGSGASPIGFQVDFLTSHRLQPFVSTNEGANYYDQPTLIPNVGPRLLYTADFGAGVNIFRKRRQALTLGYRHQYLAGDYPGASTQANLFYVGVSRFRTREGADDTQRVF